MKHSYLNKIKISPNSKCFLSGYAKHSYSLRIILYFAFLSLFKSVTFGWVENKFLKYVKLQIKLVCLPTTSFRPTVPTWEPVRGAVLAGLWRQPVIYLSHKSYKVNRIIPVCRNLLSDVRIVQTVWFMNRRSLFSSWFCRVHRSCRKRDFMWRWIKRWNSARRLKPIG